MIALAQNRPADKPAGQTKFLAMLPVITRYASLAFRTLDAEAREEAMAEVLANAYVAFARLAELGKTDVACLLFMGYDSIGTASGWAPKPTATMCMPSRPICLGSIWALRKIRVGENC